MDNQPQVIRKGRRQVVNLAPAIDTPANKDAMKFLGNLVRKYNKAPSLFQAGAINGACQALYEAQIISSEDWIQTEKSAGIDHITDVWEAWCESH